MNKDILKYKIVYTNVFTCLTFDFIIQIESDKVMYLDCFLNTIRLQNSHLIIHSILID